MIFGSGGFDADGLRFIKWRTVQSCCTGLRPKVITPVTRSRWEGWEEEVVGGAGGKRGSERGEEGNWWLLTRRVRTLHTREKRMSSRNVSVASTATGAAPDAVTWDTTESVTCCGSPASPVRFQCWRCSNKESRTNGIPVNDGMYIPVVQKKHIHAIQCILSTVESPQLHVGDKGKNSARVPCRLKTDESQERLRNVMDGVQKRSQQQDASN